MSFRDRLMQEISQVDSDLRRTPLAIFFLITCLALLLAATITFGGLHL